MAQSTRTIATKLYLCFGVAMLTAFLLGGTALFNISRMDATLTRVVDQDAKKVELIGDARGNIQELVSLERAIAVRTFMKDHPSIEKYHGQQAQELESLKKHLAQLTPLINTPEGKEFSADLAEASGKFEDIDRRLYAFAMSDKADEVTNLYSGEILTFSKGLLGKVDPYLEVVSGQLQQSKESASSQAQGVMWFTGILLLVCVGVGAAVVWVVRGINNDLRGAASDLSTGADQIASAAAQVSSSSQSLAQGASTQAASIEETSASSEQINSMAKRNSENAQATATIVAASDLRFAETSISIADMVSAMQGISESSEKISRIIKVIDQIAFQTNILALNAAVEAARAGESGMGFAVVAEEVRNLAQRSAQAAQDTASLIEESIGKSHAGNVKVEQVATVIRAITADAARMKTLVDEINNGSIEQSRGVEQVSRAIRQMEVTTQGNAANAEESAAAAEQLTAQSESVKEIVAHLNSLVGGGSSSRSIPSLGKLSRPGARAKSTALASFKAVVKPRPAPAAARAVHAGHDVHDAEASFHEF